MTAVADTPGPGTGPGSAAPAFEHLDLAVHAAIHEASESGDGAVSETELIDQIAHLETLRNSLDALQSTLIRTFARTHVATRTAAGVVEPEMLERSVAAQVGLACRVSPTVGRTRLRVARDLHEGLDHVRGLFTAGELSSQKAQTVVTATGHLDGAERAEVDRRLVAHDIAHLSVGRLRDLARTVAAQVAPETFLVRATAARAHRRVTLRPAADGMTDLIAHLPAEQGAACLAALHQAVREHWTRREPVTRGRGQILADTLVERVTGQTHADAIDFAVQIVVPVEALLDPGSPLPAEIPGHGPVPVDLLATHGGTTTWRRLVTRDGIVTGGDTRHRAFTGLLADLIRARDQYRCAEPYCDAPIRHSDHIRQYAKGGRTVLGNGRGLCVFHNQVREQPGWNVQRVPDGIRTTTPTGHTYLSKPKRRPDHRD